MIKLRVCWDFAFETNVAKFCSERGEMNEYSLCYTNEEQRSAGENLASVGQSVKSQHALTAPFKPRQNMLHFSNQLTWTIRNKMGSPWHLH